MSAINQQTSKIKVGLKPKLYLGVGFFALFFANQSIPILAIPFYQMTLHVDPFLLGIALTIPIIVSTLLGPWVGHLSDNFESKFGRRKPFILLASWCCCVLFGLIWLVSPQWQESTQLLYFTFFSILYYIALIFLSVPMTSLSYEMSEDHHERTEIMGFTSYFIKIGSLLYQWLFPLAQLTVFSSIFVGIKVIGWGIAILLIGLLGTIPAIYCQEKTYIKSTRVKASSVLHNLKTLKNNKPLRILLILTALQLCGGAFSASMDYYLIVYYLNEGNIVEGSIWKGVLSTSYAIAGIISIALITHLSPAYGKINTLKFIYFLNAFGGIMKWFIFTPGSYWLLVFDAVFCAAIWAAMSMLIPSMLADLCDEDELMHKERREGLFASLHTWVVNFSMAIAFLLSGISLTLIGFDAANGQLQTSESILLMRVTLSFGTFIFSLIPLWFLKDYKIDANTCLATRQQLDQKQR